MSLKADFYIGLRNFRHYRKGGLSLCSLIGAVLSIGLSMVPVIVVLEVSSGMIEGITRRYIEVSSFHIQAGTYSDYEEENEAELLESLRQIEGVEEAAVFIEGQGLLYSETGRSGVHLRGVDSSIYSDDPGFRENINILQGHFNFDEDGRGLLISEAIAKDLGIKAGDPLKLLVSRTSARGNRPLLKPGNYRVSGVFTTGYHELDKILIYMDYERAARVFGKEGTLGIGIKTEDYSHNMAPILEKVRRSLPDSWYVLPWYDMERSLYRNFETTRIMLLFIMAIIIVVAAVNISSSMLNMVMEKQEQIAVLKSMGASPLSIRIQFLFSGFFIGFLGVLFGIAAGMTFSVNINELISFLEFIINGIVFIGEALFYPGDSPVFREITILNPEYYLEDIPLRIPLMETMLIGSFTMLTTILASWAPAKRASKILPLEILRHHG